MGWFPGLELSKEQKKNKSEEGVRRWDMASGTKKLRQGIICHLVFMPTYFHARLGEVDTILNNHLGHLS
jgi:hypothetical protein